MNLKAIIAALVLGSSSVAMAAPSVTVSATVHAENGTVVVRDHRPTYQTPPIMRPPVVAQRPGRWSHPPIVVQAPPARPPVIVQSPPIIQPGRYHPPILRSVTLASDITFAADQRTFIQVGAQAGTFGKLEISGAAGRTYVQQVYVQFADGQEQIVRNLDRTLMNGQCLTLDLDGDRRAINRIVVYGQNLDNGIRHEVNGFNVVAS